MSIPIETKTQKTLESRTNTTTDDLELYQCNYIILGIDGNADVYLDQINDTKIEHGDCHPFHDRYPLISDEGINGDEMFYDLGEVRVAFSASIRNSSLTLLNPIQGRYVFHVHNPSNSQYELNISNICLTPDEEIDCLLREPAFHLCGDGIVARQQFIIEVKEDGSIEIDPSISQPYLTEFKKGEYLGFSWEIPETLNPEEIESFDIYSRTSTQQYFSYLTTTTERTYITDEIIAENSPEYCVRIRFKNGYVSYFSNSTGWLLCQEDSI